MTHTRNLVRNTLVAALPALASLALAPDAAAQWTVTNLHVGGSTESDALAAAGGEQAGYVNVAFLNHASWWSGSAASWVDLNPAGSTQSRALAASGSVQAGYAYIGGSYHAGLWSGSALSWTDLNPAGLGFSWINAMGGGQQAGYVSVGGSNHASRWAGTSASWVDLHPAGALSSIANATDGLQQGGFANLAGVNSASLWSGSAASWVSLAPAGASDSRVYGISGGRQAGSALVSGKYRASLWTGTVASWIDLSPAGTNGSEAYAMNATEQVGYATVGGIDHASLWSGSAASWVDLATFLPPGFTYSYAQAITSDAAFVYVSGYGFHSTTGRFEALLWKRSLAPGTDLCQAGVGGVSVCPCANPPANAPRGCDNSSATGGAQLTSSGAASLAADTLVFATNGEKSTATSVVLQGNALAASGLVFGQGVRCVGGSLKRLYVRTAAGGTISAPGAGDPSVSARSAALGDAIGAGASRWYAVYYRDPVVLGGCPAASTFNITQTQVVNWGA